jgi:holo-[acyl-carrier protein] synthase
MSPKQPLGATSRPQALVLRDRLPDLPPRHTDEAMPCVHFDIDSLDGQMCEVSISHDTTYATAVALVPVVEEWQSLAEKPQGQDHKG